MAAVDNTIVYKEEWATKLQERLSENTKFKEICRVEYTNTRVLNNPYLTDPTVQSHTRGCPYTFQRTIETNESITISTSKILPMAIDRGDFAQSTFLKQMDFADMQGVLLNEAIEAAVYADYSNITTFDNTELGGSSGNITVSVTNIDDIVRAVKRKIRVAGGENLMDRYGVFIVWRPADLELLEQFMQANGFNVADAALQRGAYQGIRFMGVDHFSSNQLTAGHVIAGVKNVYHLGILKDTYGQIMVDEKDPGQLSGIAVVSRVDYAIKAWTKTKPVLYNVTVA